MKKLLSLTLAFALIITSLSGLNILKLSALDANGLPESEEELNGSLSISTLEDYQANFSAVNSSTYLETPAQFTSTEDLYYDNGENSVYYWKDNGYTVALSTANSTGYFTGIDEDRLSSVTMSTDFMTAANGIFNFTAANAFSVEMNTDSGSSQTIAFRPKVFGALKDFLFYYTDCFDDSEVDFDTTIYNNAGTAELTTSGRTYGLVKDYFGTGKYAVVYKSQAATDYFNDGKTYYYFYLPARVVGDKVCHFANLALSGVAYFPWGGITGNLSYTAEKIDNSWSMTNVTLTLSESLLSLDGYNGKKGTARLYFTSRMTDNGDGTRKISYSGSRSVGENLNLQLPRFNTKCSNDAFGNMYFKKTDISYTEDPTFYLADFDAAYTAMVDAGVTAENVAEYENYVPAVKTEYNKLNDFLKQYVDNTKLSNIEAIDYAYFVGDRADAFEAAYEVIKDYVAADMNLSELEAIQPEVTACRAAYDALDDVVKGYIPSDKLNQLISLENAYSVLALNKETGTFYADFSDNTGANAAMYTSYLDKAQADKDGTASVIYGNANQANKNFWITRCISDTSSVIEVSNGVAKHVIKRTTNGTSIDAHSQNIQRSVLNAVKGDYLPQDINKISFTADISELKDGSTTYKEFLIMYGKNDNFTKYVSSTVQGYSDEPIFGTAVKVSSSGKVTFGIAYYEFVDSVLDSNVRLNHIVTDYGSMIATGNSAVAIDKMTNPGDFSDKTVDISSGKFNLEISFNSHTFTTSVTDVYTNTTNYVPTFTVVDGAGNKLSGTPYVYPYNYDSNSARRNNANAFATDIYGVAFGSYTANSKATQSLILDNIYIQGNGANAVTGATVKSSANAGQQDLRFNVTLSESDYLKSQGYSVSGYGCVLAAEYYVQNAGLSELTVEAAEALGESKAKIYTRAAADGEVPAKLFVELGNSAAAGEKVGIQYRLRSFVKYEKGDEVRYIYSQNRAEGLMENGQHIRSVYSTAKNIAAYQKNTSGVVYNSYGEENAAEFETAVTGILDGAKSTATASIGGTSVINSEILLKFVAENIGLLTSVS